jgi:antitoxin HigA-1
MAMKNPPHPGRLVRDEIEELGLTITEAASGLGVSRQQLHRVLNGKCAVSAEMAVRLEKAIGSSADAWLRMQTNYDLAQIHPRRIKVRRLERKVA